MKKVLVLLLLVLSCSTENKQKNSLEEDNLKGNVKSVREFSYVAVDKFGEISKGERKREDSWQRDFYKKYDDKGNKIEENNYKSDGSLGSKYTYKYDDKGNKIEENNYNSDGSLDYKYTYKYNYNEKNNWIERLELKNDIPQYILEREIEYY